MTVRVAIIGAGVMGSDHARMFGEELAAAELAIICDADQQRAKTLADRYGAADVAVDPMAVIQNPKVDAVVIAAPDQFHAELTLAAIAAGKPVLCEKPLSQSLDECLQVLAAEEKTRRQLVQIGFMRRFDPSYQQMKAKLQSGALGEALLLHCHHRNQKPAYGFHITMAVSNSAPHEFDIARWLLNSDITAISVTCPRPQGKIAPADVAVPVMMLLETAHGALVTIEVNIAASYGYDVRAELVCEKGSCFIQPHVGLTQNYEGKNFTTFPDDWRPRFADAYRLQNKAWLAALQQGKISAEGASAWDGYCATLVADAGLRSLDKGGKVTFAPIAKPKFYQ